jgi:hypothetical protein
MANLGRFSLLLEQAFPISKSFDLLAQCATAYAAM